MCLLARGGGSGGGGGGGRSFTAHKLKSEGWGGGGEVVGVREVINKEQQEGQHLSISQSGDTIWNQGVTGGGATFTPTQPANHVAAEEPEATRTGNTLSHFQLVLRRLSSVFAASC